MSAMKKALYAANPELLEIVRASARKGLAAVDREALRAITAKASKGRKWSDESRAKMSASCMGRVYGRDVLDRMATKKCRPVECTTLGISFRSAIDAAAFLNVSNGQIGHVCRGERPHTKGLKFKYIGG